MSPLEELLARVSIEDVWQALNLPGEPRKSMLSPFRGESQASFSVFGNRWKDHGTGEQGDVLDLIAKAQNIDLPAASRWLLERFGGQPMQPLVQKEKTVSKPVGKPSIPPLQFGSYSDVEALQRARKLPMNVGIITLRKRGLLGFLTYEGQRCWAWTDSSKRSCQLRTIDGTPLSGAKARTLAGNDASWPVGIANAEARPIVLLCEGPADCLAVSLAAWIEGHWDDVAPVAMLGASQSISNDALPLFKGKTVRIFQDNDPPGREAARRWAKQLRPYARSIDVWTSDKEGEDFTDWLVRVWGQDDDPENPLPEQIVPSISSEPRNEDSGAAQNSTSNHSTDANT
ncbi:MAG: hypothetical protein BWY82_01221 [Verrucomicrobia bacterium ADurb.Bin474]|nr:MAG: hypothetical protein BWY82_01221 [Verrucomicrobia bacterium ADurb.Bin474]